MICSALGLAHSCSSPADAEHHVIHSSIHHRVSFSLFIKWNPIVFLLPPFCSVNCLVAGGVHIVVPN